MPKTYLLIDGNSIGHMAQSMKPLTIGSFQVQAIYGFLNIIRGYVSKYSFATPIILWDGLSWRKTEYPQYKANRTKNETKADAARNESNASYHKQRPYIEKAAMYLGIPQVKAENMEADDLAAILSDVYTKQGHKVTLLTEDQDWLQLISPNIAVERPKSKDRVTMMNFEEVTGCKTVEGFVQKKALMGDGGDNIPGVGGIGEKRALEFVAEYGTFSDFLNRVLLEKSVDFDTLPKYLRDLVENEQKAIDFDFNLKLVDLKTTARPAPKNMVVVKNQESAENFQKMCEVLLFNSILRTFDDWISAFPVGQTQNVSDCLRS